MKLLILFFVLFFCIFSTESRKHEFASATVSAGKIKGYVVEPNVNRTNAVNVFKGIPFAEPPVGELRFALPKPMKPWNGIWNATYYKAACPSNTTATTSPQKVINEDCLYLNIFADQICMTKKCPVLYIVHGGAFYYDSAVMFNDEYLIQNYASKGIIVVIPAYRIGLFGFLDLGSDDPVPRNLGIHDLVSSLYWVKKEIHAFGGDPDRVTIFGNSVGGSAIAFLSAAPSVPLLWSQAFISSPDCVMMENKMVPQTYAVLEKAGCLYVGNSSNMTLPAELQVKCLRKLDWKQLIGIQRDIEDQSLLFDGVEPDNLLFNDKSFTQLIGQYKAVPTVIGTTTEEFKCTEDEISHYCNQYVKIFDYKEDATVQACIDKYSDIIDSNGNVPVVADMVRAETFRIAMQIVKRKEPVWLYSWELEKHIYHTGDVSFLIGLHPIDPKNATWKEKLMLKYMPTVLHNFVTKGYPDKEWLEFTSYGDNYEVLDFTNETRTLRGPHPIFQPWFPEAVSFWLGDLAAIEKAAREARLRNETINAEEKWDIIAEDAREHQWKKFRDALNKSQERFKEWTNRKNEQWEKVREKNEKEYAEKIHRMRERDEAERHRQQNGIIKFTDLILAQSIKETEESLKARRRQLENTGDKEGVEKIDEMLRDLGDWRNTVGDDGRVNWMPIHKAHKYNNEAHSDSAKKESSNHHDLLDQLSPEEKNAARKIWEEQEAALHRQQHQHDLNNTNPNIGQRINGTIDDIRNAINESNPGSINEHDQKIYNDLTNDTRLKDIHNETIDKIQDAKKDITNKLNDTKYDVANKWNDTLNDVNNRIEDAKKDIANKKKDMKENLNDTDKKVEDKMKDEQKLRNETYDIYRDAQKDVNQKLNDTQNDVANKWNDTAKDIHKKINDTKDDIDDLKYKGINVNEKDWIRRHNGTEGNITDDLKNIKNGIVDKWDDVKHGIEDTWNDVKNGVERGWNGVVNNNNTANDEKDWQQRHNNANGDGNNHVINVNGHDAIKDANEKIRKLEEKKQRIFGNFTGHNHPENGHSDSWEKEKEKERKEALKIVADENAKDEKRMNEKMKEMKKNAKENWEETLESKKQKLQEAEDEAREAAAEQREAEAEKAIVEKRLHEAMAKEAEAKAAQSKAKEAAAKEKEHLQKAKKEREEAIVREEEAKKEQAQENQNLLEASEKERAAAEKEIKATKKAIQEELDLTAMKIREAQHKLQKAEDILDKEIESRKIAAQAVVDSLRNATYERFLERQKLEEKYQNFVNYLRNETMKDISEKLRKSHIPQNKLSPNAKIHDYLKNRTIPSRLPPQFESQLFSPLSFLAIPQFDNDNDDTVADLTTTEQLRQVWSAFWVVLTLATLLAFILCLNAIMACTKPSRSNQGYFYNDDPGFFTEKSKIIVAQYPNYS